MNETDRKLLEEKWKERRVFAFSSGTVIQVYYSDDHDCYVARYSRASCDTPDYYEDAAGYATTRLKAIKRLRFEITMQNNPNGQKAFIRIRRGYYCP